MSKLLAEHPWLWVLMSFAAIGLYMAIDETCYWISSNWARWRRAREHARRYR